MEAGKSLYYSNFCRLCSENNDHGIDIFSITEESIELSLVLNKYLPIKIQDDKKFPKRICPGCHIQLESMKLFMDLIIEGQVKLRNMFRNQQERHIKETRQKQQLEAALHNVNPNSSVESFTIQSDEDGDKFLIQILSDGPLFPPEHELALRAEGLERPKKKRGRPSKSQVTELDKTDVEEPSPQDIVLEENEFEEDDRPKKRKIKAPVKFEGIVQGDELENILKKEGVLDDEIITKNDIFCVKKHDEIIVGRAENGNGEDLGQPVFFHNYKSKSKIGYLKKKNKKKFECDICDKEFFNHGHYLLHKKTHNHLYVCDHCGFGKNDRNITNQHQAETGHHGITVTDYQDIDVSVVNTKTTEIIVENPPSAITCQNFVCGECNKSFSTKQNLEVHNRAVHNQSVVNTKTTEIIVEDPPSDVTSQKSVCGECNKSFSTKQNLEVHNRAVHNQVKPFECHKCDKTFAYASTLKFHSIIHDREDGGNAAKGFPCDTCGKVMAHPSSLAYHKESEHGAGNRFVCTRCDKTFKHRQLLLRHQLVHTERRPYTCKKCDATFKSQANLANHEVVHSGARKYVCKVCGQRYAHRTSLTLHQRWHDGEKPYNCEFCDKSFSQKGNLLEHRRIHTGEKPFCCDECGKSFTTSSQFQMHKKRHTGVKPWTCEFCHKRFLHADSYKAHVNRHLEYRPHRCTLCERSFVDPWSLKRHLRTHTGERPYRCERCDKRFADSSNKYKHMRQHEREDKARREKGVEAEGAVGGVVEKDAALEIRQLTDHQGNPISITTQDGKTVPVVTVGDDDESIQGLMPDGTLIPIEIATEPVKEVPKLCITEESSMKEPILMDDSTGIVQVNGAGLDPGIFVTDDSGQGVCLVYTMEENNEVDQQLAIDPLLIQSR
ncbi:unnamed protein product [Phaedon cochleariae]|uniref:Uncharacterized protein n=1 Tax=Phaedon cochleariae TaxID=80249 RepID=A0A9P0DVS2_PHACE|nr:unnamed protein product [Phaedon cochleariae]